jgi:hypothetical protein
VPGLQTGLLRAVAPGSKRLQFTLRAFPFFILYGLADESLIFGLVIPSRSDPLTWLTRFK